MLKIISENNTTGYEIIKKIKEITGEKPSTGSVYPILKSMARKGWITGKTLNGKTLYAITDSGKNIIDAHSSTKKYYEQKISGSIILAQDTFSNLHMTKFHKTTLINQLAEEISILIAHGVAPEKINSVLSKTITALQKIK
jgi:DNA-binding PadR family transcriptional regulator